MLRTLSFVRENLLYFILGALFLGLLNGYYNQVGYLKPLVLPILIVMVYPMMITIRLEEVLATFKDWPPVLLSLIINFILMPALAFGTAAIFFPDNPVYAVACISSPCCPRAE
jgi:ACR3 family arsenite efflux pump ArsB